MLVKQYAACLALALGVSTAAHGGLLDNSGLGPAGILRLNKMPACVGEDFANAYKRCLPPRATPGSTDAERMQVLMQRAIVLIYLRKWDEAQQELHDELALDSKSAEVLHLAARLAASRHINLPGGAALAEADAHIAAAAKIAPADADVRATQAHILMLNGRGEDAIAAYDAAISLKPDHTFALWQRAMLQMEKGRHELALADLDKAVATAPEDPLLRRARVDLLILFDRAEDAKKDLDLLIAHNKSDLMSYVARAAVHHRLGDSKAALEDLNSLIFGPKDGMPFAIGSEQMAGFLVQRALVLADLARLSEAADDMNRAVGLSGKQNILRLQVYLRRNGLAGVPIDGAPSDALKGAIERCFREAGCRNGLLERT